MSNPPALLGAVQFVTSPAALTLSPLWLPLPVACSSSAGEISLDIGAAWESLEQPNADCCGRDGSGGANKWNEYDGQSKIDGNHSQDGSDLSSESLGV
jgi:hypothetical protein